MLRVTGPCVENSPVTGEVPAQRASNAETFQFDDVVMAFGIPWDIFIRTASIHDDLLRR